MLKTSRHSSAWHFQVPFTVISVRLGKYLIGKPPRNASKTREVLMAILKVIVFLPDYALLRP